MRSVIISDLHIGSHVCRTEDVASFVAKSNFDRLIINGDMLDHLNLSRYKKKHWKLLSALEKIQPTIILGNHDVAKEGSDLFLKSLFKSVHHEYVLPTSVGEYLIHHGHRCDPLMDYSLLTEAADRVYHLSQKVSKKLARWLKKKSKKMGGFLDLLVKSAAKVAGQRGFSGVVLGHTHHAEDVRIQDVHYLNTGCWTGGDPPTYVEVRDKGMPRLTFLS